MPTVFEGSYAKITQTRRTFQRMNLYILVLKLPPLWTCYFSGNWMNVFYLSRAHTYIQTIQHKASQAGEGRAESTHKAGPSTWGPCCYSWFFKVKSKGFTLVFLNLPGISKKTMAGVPRTLMADRLWLSQAEPHTVCWKNFRGGVNNLAPEPGLVERYVHGGRQQPWRSPNRACAQLSFDWSALCRASVLHPHLYQQHPVRLPLEQRMLSHSSEQGWPSRCQVGDLILIAKHIDSYVCTI